MNYNLMRRTFHTIPLRMYTQVVPVNMCFHRNSAGILIMNITRSKQDGFALIIQLWRVLGGVGGVSGVGGVGDIPTTYIQLAGAGSIM